MLMTKVRNVHCIKAFMVINLINKHKEKIIENQSYLSICDERPINVQLTILVDLHRSV